MQVVPNIAYTSTPFAIVIAAATTTAPNRDVRRVFFNITESPIVTDCECQCTKDKDNRYEPDDTQIQHDKCGSVDLVLYMCFGG